VWGHTLNSRAHKGNTGHLTMSGISIREVINFRTNKSVPSSNVIENNLFLFYLQFLRIIHASFLAFSFICMYVCMCVCMYVCMYVCVYVCMCVCTYNFNILFGLVNL
jgi:hypothetical protein